MTDSIIDSIILKAETRLVDGIYCTGLAELGLECSSDSLDAAHEEFVHIVRSWIEFQDTAGTLSDSLSELGFLGVGEETEIHLEFLEDLA